MKSQAMLSLIFALAIRCVQSNFEVDVLSTWKAKLVDPSNTLESWDSKDLTPCLWSRITCNSNSVVTRVDLGDRRLSGPLVTQLGSLTDLQYLELYNNDINGSIPQELGNLTNLVSLDLFENSLSGSIPASLGNLKSLRYLRLNDNQLSGQIPPEVIQLMSSGMLTTMNVSGNNLEGTGQENNRSGASNHHSQLLVGFTVSLLPLWCL